MEWVLIIYMGISGGGIASQSVTEFPNKEACRAELSMTRVEGANHTSGEDDEQQILFCAPKGKTQRGGKNGPTF